MTGVDEIVTAARLAWQAAPPLGDEAYPAFGTRLPAALDEHWPQLAEANAADLDHGRERGFPEPLLERMRLTRQHLNALRELAASVAADMPAVLAPGPPVTGRDGVRSRRAPRPLGVVLMVHEARPAVAVEVALLAVSTGNAVILRPGTEIALTTAALDAAIADAVAAAGLPAGMVRLLDDADRRLLRGLLARHDAIDVLIPRGSLSLIDYCQDATRIPLIASGSGVNHLYVHRSADIRAAALAALDSKLPAPAGCTSLEMLLADEPAELLTALGAAVAERDWPPFELRVPIDLMPVARSAGLVVEPLDAVDDGREFLDRTLALRRVAGLDEAIAHVARHGSGHTEGVFATDREVVDRFCDRVDAATVVVNGSLRLNDGPTMGIGPELAISTNRLHVRGPVTLDALVTHCWVVEGNGVLRDEPPPPRQAVPDGAAPPPPATPPEGAELPPEGAAAPDGATREVVSTVVRRLVIRESRLSIPAERIGEDELLDGPLLKINSLGFVGMLVRLEDELDVSLPDEVVVGRRFDTVGDLVDVIAGTVGGERR